jgi:hypothetical protein
MLKTPQAQQDIALRPLDRPTVKGARRRIDLAWLLSRGACDGHTEIFKRTFPGGAEVSLEMALLGRSLGIDSIWAAIHLMPKSRRRDFIVFTLQQRQPHLAVLARRDGRTEDAARIDGLDWSHIRHARKVLAQAGVAVSPDGDAHAALWDAVRACDWIRWDRHVVAWDAARAAAWAAARATGSGDEAVVEQLKWLAGEMRV